MHAERHRKNPELAIQETVKQEKKNKLKDLLVQNNQKNMVIATRDADGLSKISSEVADLLAGNEGKGESPFGSEGLVDSENNNNNNSRLYTQNSESNLIDASTTSRAPRGPVTDGSAGFRRDAVPRTSMLALIEGRKQKAKQKEHENKGQTNPIPHSCTNSTPHSHTSPTPHSHINPTPHSCISPTLTHTHTNPSLDPDPYPSTTLTPTLTLALH